MNLGSIIEREEKRVVYRIHCSSDENSVEDEMDGGIGVSWDPKRRWLLLEEPFRFFDGSAIWGSFWKLWSVEMKENEKWWILGFVGLDLDNNWGRNRILKFRNLGVVSLQKSCSSGFWKIQIYRQRRSVINFRNIVIDYT